MKVLISTAFAICLCLFGIASVSATTVVKLDFDQLVQASDLVVVAEVKAVEAVVEDGRVFTRVRIAVTETLKGTHRAEVTIFHIGGRTQTLATRVSGMPSFTAGERALLFLEQPRGYNHFVVTGLAQGKLSLRTNDDGSTEILPNKVHLHTIPTRPKAETPTAPVAPIVTLDDARTRIAALSATSTP